MFRTSIACANILWKHVSRYAYPVEKAQDDLDVLHALAYTVPQLTV
jgi:hypothetical protein